MAREFAKILQEDINTGIDPATKPNPGGGTLSGTQVGLHSWAIGQVPLCYDFAETTIAAGGSASQVLDFPGLVLGDHAEVMTSFDLSGILMHWGVTEDAVTVYLRNLTGSAIVLPVGTLSVLGFKIRTCAGEEE